MITAPFNFVPLNKEVYFPDWSRYVLHDVPLKDSQNGEIEIVIKAESPIFIRDSEDETKFFNFKGDYYIPGSSFKGMLRNVLEIMSFAKLGKDLINDNRYAVRDLSKADNFYMKEMKDGVKAGWLFKENGKYFIEDCGEPLRISHKEIDKALQVTFSRHFESDGFEKTSEYKYEIIGGPYKKIRVGKSYISKSNPKYDKRKFCKFDPKGKEGTLVLTGQPTKRKNTGKMGDGKGFEFVFMDPVNVLEVNEEVFEDFKLAYFDGRDTQPKESPDWKYWKEKLENNQKVPVFFKEKDGKVLHFGLSYLYKLPYKHTPSHGIPVVHFSSKKDLPETVFGYIGNSDSLKGRVFISHFKAVENIRELPLRSEILGTPRASYYPIYLKQDGGEYVTYMNDAFELAGRKRYPIRRNNTPISTQNTGNQDVATSFRPLAQGVVFKGKIRFFNLNKIELGAILSALTFHNTPGTYHNIGMGKPLGYGKIKVEVNFENMQEYMKEFEKDISMQIKNWADSDEITELVTMASEQDINEEMLKYMDLSQFAKLKNKKEYLRRYSQLPGVRQVKIKSLLTEEELKNMEFEKNYKKELEKALNSNDIKVLESFLEKAKDEDVKIIEEKIKNLKTEIEKKKQGKFKEINEKAKKAFNEVKSKKGSKGFEKAKEKFIKKWSKEKEHKGSEYVLNLLEEVKNL